MVIEVGKSYEAMYGSMLTKLLVIDIKRRGKECRVKYRIVGNKPLVFLCFCQVEVSNAAEFVGMIEEAKIWKDAESSWEHPQQVDVKYTGG